MRLEVGSITIQGLEFGGQTALRDHTLVIDREEIRQLVLEDQHFADADVHIARPGESVRIIHALDIVEPRWKVEGPGGVFPGFVAPPTTAGEGRTHRLAGVAVVGTGDPVPGEPTHWREKLIDMSGSGAPYSPFSQTLNLVLRFRPNLDFFPPGAADLKDFINGGPEAAEYSRATILAGMKVAARLARASQDRAPDQVETFELPPCDPDLPRVVCVCQHLHNPFLYGMPVRLQVGTLIHPNESFDGALTGWRGASWVNSTYWEQNNEVFQQLCRRHGRDLNFLGAILFGGTSFEPPDKERVSSATSKLARLLGAQAAVFLGHNGSNYSIDVMLAIQKCEQAGIRTALLYFDVGYGSGDPGFIFAVPEADAVVCTGSRDQLVALSPMKRVLGGDRLIVPDLDPSGELTVPMGYFHGSIGVQGYNRLTTRFE